MPPLGVGAPQFVLDDTGEGAVCPLTVGHVGAWDLGDRGWSSRESLPVIGFRFCCLIAMQWILYLITTQSAIDCHGCAACVPAPMRTTPMSSPPDSVVGPDFNLLVRQA